MHAIILGGTSDIGKEIAKRLLRDGWEVTGTYRNEKPSTDGVKFHRCDLPFGLECFIEEWDLFVSCVGTMEPIGPFVKTWGKADGAWWNMGANLLWPLQELRKQLPLRNPKASIMFSSGANTNSAHPNYFAYSIAKIATIKAMELLDAELPDCKCFALGPGYILTKMHEQIRRAGLEPAPKLKGATHDDVYECLMWAHSQPKSVIGGRNIAAHTDDWRNPAFAEMLSANPEIYKLRRLT